MELKYTNEFILNENGIKCRVLDISKIDFSQAIEGRKIKETLVLKANGNERIETINSDGLVEATYITSPGDAIFVNNEQDIYVPRDSFGMAFKFDSIEEYGYENFYITKIVQLKLKAQGYQRFCLELL